jgi:hypothetical protein
MADSGGVGEGYRCMAIDEESGRNNEAASLAARGFAAL